MEGRGFRDRAPEFVEAGAEVLGISFDPSERNKGFAQKNGFPFRLLSDVDRKVGEAYETKRAPAERSPEYAKRRTYLIDPGGTIVKSYRVTDIPAHPDQVLGDLRELQERAPA
jgi:thioredoxin-dependent peroxiredoxin